MPCHCMSTSLGLFVRNVARIEIRSTRLSSNRSRFPITAVRDFTSTRTKRDEHASPSDVAKAVTNTLAGVGPVEGDLPANARVVPKKPRRRNVEFSSGEGRASSSKSPSSEVFIAEVSPQSIDAIALESESKLENMPNIRSSQKTRSGPDELPGLRSHRASKAVEETVSASDSNHSLEPDTGLPPIRRVGAPNRNYQTLDLNASLETISTEKRSKYREGIFSERRSKGDESTKEDEWIPPPKEPWMVYKDALQEKFPEGWNPIRRLSPDALAGIRALHAQMPEQYTTAALAESFKMSPEAIRRILKSKWTPNSEEETDRIRRWTNRGKAFYEKHSARGYKPPKKWREMGIRMPNWKREQRVAARAAQAPLPALITTKRAPLKGAYEGSDTEML